MRKYEVMSNYKELSFKPSDKIVVRRRVFGFLFTVLIAPASEYRARISSAGVLCLLPINQNDSISWAFAIGEWSTCEPLSKA